MSAVSPACGVRVLLGGKQVIDGLDEGVTCDLDPHAVLLYDVRVMAIEPR